MNAPARSILPMKLFSVSLFITMAALPLGAVEVDKAKLPPPAVRSVDFAKDIQPLFEKHCLKCHGPEKQKSGWRVDLKESALKGGDNYAPNIVPGKSADSPLIHFVAGLEEDMIMPQKGDRLTAEQIGLLRAWIDQGAAWPDEGASDPKKTHWAFQPLKRPPVPDIHASRITNPIDSFITAKLAEKAIALSPEADRRTLIRRLSFYLIGLPPTPEEIDTFVSDHDPRAYEKLVDRLLASPRYGERWARHWLDVVRFAESDGFETNLARANAWPYRDYVIRAFNDDVPFDRFVREQIVGDLLGVDEATGFIVGGAVDKVKSPDPVLTAQQRADELHDIVSTTGSAFLGLTVGCARCHNHKFDPISQTDYYALTAVFQGVLHGERPMRPHDAEGRARKSEALRATLAPIEARLSGYEPQAHLGRRLLIDANTPPPADPNGPSVTNILPPQNSSPISYAPGNGQGQANDPGDLARLPNLGGGYRFWENKNADGSRIDFFSWNPHISGRFRVWLSWGAWTTHGHARYVLDRDGDAKTRDDQTEIAYVELNKFPDGSPVPEEEARWSGFRLAGVHEFTPSTRLLLCGGIRGGPVADTVLFEEVLDDEEAAAQPESPHLRPPVSPRANVERFAPQDARFVRFTISASSGGEPCLDELEVFSDGPESHNIALASLGTKATASGVYAKGSNAFHQIAHLNDGQYGNARSWISDQPRRGWVQLELPRVERISRIVWSRDRSSTGKAYEDRLATDYVIEVSVDGEHWKPVASSADRLGEQFRKRVPEIPTLSAMPRDMAGEIGALITERAQLQTQIKEFAPTLPVYAGKFAEPGRTFRLHRGDPMQPKEEVAPGALASFGRKVDLAADAPEPQRRRALADWIADPQNPLTARVLVNRIWHYHFGTGLVDTPSDFGLNGGKPTHPELLDWLACEFIARGWSIKELHRLIVKSATYRQSSAQRPAAVKVDAGSRLLWRFPPRRLEAEPLRDTILAVSGKLDLRMGGPGFDLFEPMKNYVKVYTSKRTFSDEDFRRMIYQAKPRTQLDEVFGAFDCPDAGQVAPRRTSSTTPLQALNLLNSSFALQQAGFFAERLEKETGADPKARVRRAFVLSFGREPAADETAAALKLIGQHGLKVFCRALFNANEFINVF